MTDSMIKKLDELEEKIKNLISANQSIYEKLKEKNEENKKLKTQLETKNNQLNIFQNKIKMSNIAERLAAQGDVSEWKKVLEEMIKEVERCIAYLNEA